MLKLIDRRIRRAFSNAAMQYDILTGMQKEIGREPFVQGDLFEIDRDGLRLTGRIL